MRTLIFPIILYKLCAGATPKPRRPLLPKNYVRIVAVAPTLQRVFFYVETAFHSYSTTIKLLPLLALMKGSYPSLRALP
jgi:hypothetical protein